MGGVFNRIYRLIYKTIHRIGKGNSMEIKSKFSLGQVVWIVKKISREKTCDVCKGTGSIMYDGYEMKCPKCGGTGKIEDNLRTVYTVSKPLIICKIKSSSWIRNNKNKEQITTWTYNVKPNKRNNKNMEIHISESRLFSSEQEAQKACDELNSNLKEQPQ